MAKDIAEYCKCCDTRQIVNNKFTKQRPELHPIPVSDVWKQIGIDLIGPLTETERGNNHCHRLLFQTQVFNCDETGVTIVFKPNKVVAELGKRHVYALSAAEKGKTHTVLSCMSATGFTLPPMMIYPRKTCVSDKLKEGAYPNTLFVSSESGWVNAVLLTLGACTRGLQYFVCLSVCLFVCYQSPGFFSRLYDKLDLPARSSLVFLGFQLTDFDKTVLFGR